MEMYRRRTGSVGIAGHQINTTHGVTRWDDPQLIEVVFSLSCLSNEVISWRFQRSNL